MEEINNRNEMLELLQQPAFLVQNGIIIQCNQAAELLLIEPGTAVSTLLGSGAVEYEQFDGGCLYLPVKLPGHQLGASVTRLQDQDIFTLDPDTDQPELRAMALAARDFREPLGGVLTLAERLFPLLEENGTVEIQNQIAQMNQRLYQMLRMVVNMSDVSRYHSERQPKLICQDICAVLDEIFDKASHLVSTAGLTLQYDGLREPVVCLIDEEKLERAVYNILSNSIKFTAPGGTIRASLTKRDNRLCLSIQDSGSGIPRSVMGNIFTRYQRQPGLEDGRYGLGLGMALVRAAATAHEGAVLITHPAEGGTRITMTLAIRQSDGTLLRSNVLRVDYAGERDHGLLELSDALPFEPYKSER